MRIRRCPGSVPGADGRMLAQGLATATATVARLPPLYEHARTMTMPDAAAGVQPLGTAMTGKGLVAGLEP